MLATASPANWKHVANAGNVYVPPDFTGQVVLNCHQGKVANVNVRQTFNAKMDTKGGAN